MCRLLIMDIIRERNHVICCVGVRYLKTLTEYEKKRLVLYIQWETPNHYFAFRCGNIVDVILIRPTTTEGQLTLCARWIRHCLIFVFVFSSSANKVLAVATGTASLHPALLCDNILILIKVTCSCTAASTWLWYWLSGISWMEGCPAGGRGVGGWSVGPHSCVQRWWVCRRLSNQNLFTTTIIKEHSI